MNDLEYYTVSYRGDEELGSGPFTYLDEDLVNAEDGVAFDLFVPDPSLTDCCAALLSLLD